MSSILMGLEPLVPGYLPKARLAGGEFCKCSDRGLSPLKPVKQPRGVSFRDAIDPNEEESPDIKGDCDLLQQCATLGAIKHHHVSRQ